MVDHLGKAAALRGFFANLLGRCCLPDWRFDLEALYQGVPGVDGGALVSPFTLAEIKDAAGLLDRSSAPGPDGLGPAFYQAAWEAVSGDLL